MVLQQRQDCYSQEFGLDSLSLRSAPQNWENTGAPPTRPCSGSAAAASSWGAGQLWARAGCGLTPGSLAAALSAADMYTKGPVGTGTGLGPTGLWGPNEAPCTPAEHTCDTHTF